MTARTWLYAQLGSLTSHGVGNRVFAKKSMISSREQTPYIVYKLGNDTDEGLSETVTPHRQFLQIFVHDFEDAETADYMRIDDVLAEMKTKLKLASSPDDGVIAVTYLETSADFNDDTLKTVMKYIRFQLIMEE